MLPRFPEIEEMCILMPSTHGPKEVMISEPRMQALYRAYPRLGATILLLALSFLLVQPFPAGAEAARVHFSPAVGQVRVGETLTVQLQISSVSGLFGLNVRIQFDARLLEVVDADPTQRGVQCQTGNFPYPDFIGRHEVNNGVGSIWYAATQVSPREPVSGSGTALTITFLAKAAGVSVLEIYDVQLVGVSGLGLEATGENGQIIVLPMLVTPTPTPLPPSPTPRVTSTPQLVETVPPPTATRSLTPSATPWRTDTPLPTSSATATPLVPAPTRTVAAYPAATVTAPTMTLTASPQIATPTASSLPATPTALPQSSPTTPLASATPKPGAGATAVPSGTRTVAPSGVSASPTPSTGQAAPQPSAAARPAPPTVGRSATPAPKAEQPLVPRGVFVCCSAGLVLITLALALYVGRWRKTGAF